MGLFSSLGKVFKAALPVIGTAVGGPLGGAIGGIGSSLLSGSSNKNAIGDANAATQLGLSNAEGALNGQLGASQGRLDPYEAAGTDALSQIRAMLGLNGNDAQSGAIASLKDSPLFKSLMQNGQDTLLNNASATGGLRGGNFEHSLAGLGTDTLAQTIQQMIGNWSGLTTAGLGATQFGAGLGADNARSIADLLVGSGKANAGSILGQQGVDNNTDSQIQKLLGGTGVQDQLSAFLKNLTGGGSSIFSGAGSGYGAGGGSLPNFPKINIALPSASAGVPGF